MNNLSIFHYLPIITTILSFIFAYKIFDRYRKINFKGRHLFWWGLGVMVFGMGTFAEGYITLLGWNPVIFKFWYIVGALLGGAPLAQGTVWFLLKESTARRLTYALVSVVLVSAILVTLSPINYDLVNPNLPSGKVLVWQWTRGFSPFINLYAVIFLVGGAVLSAWRFRKRLPDGDSKNLVRKDRFIGNVLIAIGAILPGIGGAYTRAGYTLILYIAEFLGILLIWGGYWFNVRKRPVK
jgi:hypothetical protein